LGGDADDDAGQRPTKQQVLERDGEDVEDRQD